MHLGIRYQGSRHFLSRLDHPLVLILNSPRRCFSGAYGYGQERDCVERGRAGSRASIAAAPGPPRSLLVNERDINPQSLSVTEEMDPCSSHQLCSFRSLFGTAKAQAVVGALGGGPALGDRRSQEPTSLWQVNTAHCAVTWTGTNESFQLPASSDIEADRSPIQTAARAVYKDAIWESNNG